MINDYEVLVTHLTKHPQLTKSIIDKMREDESLYYLLAITHESWIHIRKAVAHHAYCNGLMTREQMDEYLISHLTTQEATKEDFVRFWYELGVDNYDLTRRVLLRDYFNKEKP